MTEPTAEPLTLGKHYKLRPGVEADHDLVRDSWRRTYTGPWSDFIMAPTFDQSFRSMKAGIDRALATSDLLVACAADDEAQVLGWICYRTDSVLHYLHVKSGFRRSELAAMGISGSLGKALFEAAMGVGCARAWCTFMHTAHIATGLTPRKRKSDGRVDREHRVPTWWIYGCRLHFSPLLLLLDRDERKDPA